MKRWMRVALASTIAAVSVAATGNWLTTVERTVGGHRLGNPEAKMKLMEFVSYTCPHCAHFERDSEGAIKLAYVQPGTVSVEVRHIIRDPIDLTAAMLTNCGTKDRFFLNHTAFMLSQDEWLKKAQATTPAQRQRWSSGDLSGRWRAIASDLGFYKIMEGRGYSRPEIEKCLGDDAKARQIVEQSGANSETYGITGTPSFAIDGKTLAEVHTWQALQEAIKTRL